MTFSRQFYNYLLGHKFIIRMDHNCLFWLMSFKNLQGQLAHWLQDMSQYYFQILYRQGKKHGNEDRLSVILIVGEVCDCYTLGSTPESLPCFPNHHCNKVNSQWDRTLQDVNDVLP